MKPFVVDLAATYLDVIEVRRESSVEERRAWNRNGLSHHQCRLEIFKRNVRAAVERPPFTSPLQEYDDNWPQELQDSFLAQIAPFVSAEYGHLGAGFVFDDGALPIKGMLSISVAEKHAVEQSLRSRQSTYVELPPGAVQAGDGSHVRAVFVTSIPEAVFKWSAVLVNETLDDIVGFMTWTGSWHGLVANSCYMSSYRPIEDQESATGVPLSVARLVYAALARLSDASQRSGTSKHATSRLLRVLSGPFLHEPVLDQHFGVEFRMQRISANGSSVANPFSSNGRKLDKHIIVPKHRKWVACGKGRKERREVWVEPYHKGPLDKPIETRSPVTIIRPPELPDDVG